MKRLLLIAGILVQLTSYAQYQVQKGRWVIHQTVGGFAYSKTEYKTIDEEQEEQRYTEKQTGFQLAFTGPDWGGLSFTSKKLEVQPSGQTAKENGFSIFLQPGAGYFISDDFMIGGNISIGIESSKRDDGNDIDKGKYFELGIGPSLRYYFGKHAKHQPFAGFDSRFDLIKERDKTDDEGGLGVEYYDFDIKGSRVMIRPFAGYAFFLGKRWTLEGRVEYNYFKETSKRETSFYVDGQMDSEYPQHSEVKISNTVIGISFGINYTF